LVFNGKRIANGLNILDVEFSGFFYVLEGFLACISLRNAARQAGNNGNVASVTLALQDHGVTHCGLLKRTIPSYARSFTA
jgi:hypothetical protein